MPPRRVAAWAASVLLAGCADAIPPAPPAPPVIVSAEVTAGTANVLSAVLDVQTTGTVKVGGRFRVSGATGDDSVAPAVDVVDGVARVPLLGLLPDTVYRVQAVAIGEADTALGEPVTFRTGLLPADLPGYAASGTDPLPGYVVFAAGKYGVVIDNTGRVVWYRRFEPNGPGLNFEAQPNGRYVARPATVDLTDIEPWVEVDPLGVVTRTFGCARGLQPRFHDLIAEPGGGYWTMCDETREMDLTAIGGVANAKVMGTVIQHIGPAGEVLFDWSPFDHFSLTDLDSASRAGASVNWTHGNAIELDADGNLLVSFRSLGEVTKIDVTTGQVLWRLGGLRNQFTFTGEPTPAFMRQHGLRRGSGEQLLLLDNLGDPTASRAERYELDESAHTARLVQAFETTPAVVTQIGGSVQPLPGGRFLVSFGTEGQVREVDALGRVMWQIDGNAGYVFRAQRIASLYAPGVGLAR